MNFTIETRDTAIAIGKELRRQGREAGWPLWFQVWFVKRLVKGTIEWFIAPTDPRTIPIDVQANLFVWNLAMRA